MNPYVLTALVMCVVVVIALAGTAYLAVFFNRRAKDDLQVALSPLATVLDSTVDVDAAEVTGRYQGYHAAGRMANASEGPGRVFQVELLDAAGGVSWSYTSNQRASSGEPPKVDFVGPDDLRPLVEKVISDHLWGILEPERERFRVEYVHNEGFLRMLRSIRSRREIPDAATFERQLDLLQAMAKVNRPCMETGQAARVDEGTS